MKKYSIHDIQVLFHIHCMHSDWPQGETQAYLESVRDLEELALIQTPLPELPWKDKNRKLKVYQTTQRGRVFIGMLLSTPVPEIHNVWVDPRTGERVTE